jgi:hypothetical protein
MSGSADSSIQTESGLSTQPRIVAVSISKKPEHWWLPEIPFYCYTEGYKAILHHDNNDPIRVSYLTERYNRAVETALKLYPDVDHIMVVDSYYLRFARAIRDLIKTYSSLDKSIVGASIWFWNRSHLRAFIQYYDTLSVKELRDKKWYSVNRLPRGLLNVSGVGGCFAFPYAVWQTSGGFGIPDPEPQAGGSRCLETHGYKICLDCESRLWRTPSDAPAIPNYSLSKRARVSLGQIRRKMLHH